MGGSDFKPHHHCNTEIQSNIKQNRKAPKEDIAMIYHDNVVVTDDGRDSCFICRRYLQTRQLK